MSADLESQVATLTALVLRLQSDMRALQDPRGRMFLADRTSPGSHRAMAEMIPTASGAALDTLTNGRTVSGSSDANVFLKIPGLRAGEAAMYGFSNGSNKVYVQISDQLRYGKIQSVGDCNSYCAVKECTLAGVELNDALVTVFPTLGGCDDVSNGFCYTVGDVIAYMRSPDDPTGGIQVGAYKTLSIGYQCGEAEGGPTNLAHVDDVARIEPYLTDFFIGKSSTCGSGHTNLAGWNWRGSMVVAGYSGGSSLSAATFIGATNTAGTGGVKVFSFDAGTGNTASLGSYPGTNSAFILFSAEGATTSANVPTLGGSPCLDNSLPLMATIKAWFPVGVTWDCSDPTAFTISQDPDTCVITLEGPTMRCLIPFP